MFAESNVVNKFFLCVSEFEIITVYNMGINIYNIYCGITALWRKKMLPIIV